MAGPGGRLLSTANLLLVLLRTALSEGYGTDLLAWLQHGPPVAIFIHAGKHRSSAGA